MLTTTGFEFAPHPVVTFSDRQKFYEKAILHFYEQHKIDYTAYLSAAWSYRHRPASRRASTIEAWAMENKLSPKYLRSLWDVLQDDAASNVFYIQWLRQRWNALPAPTEPAQMPAETHRQIQTLAEDIHGLSRILCVPETPAIISDAGNAPIPHIDRRKKTAAGRDKFNQALVEKPSQRLHLERRGRTDKLILSVARFGSETESGYVVLNQPNFSSSSPNSYNPKDGKKNLSLREFLTAYAPDELKRLNFGEGPDGQKMDPDSFVLKVPSVLEIALSAEAMKDQRTPHFYAEASLDAHALQTSGRAHQRIEPEAECRPARGERSPGCARSTPRRSSSRHPAKRFCKLFPNRFYFVDDTRGISAGFHLIEGFFRDDRPLYNSVLNEEEKRALDRLWDELYFSTNINDKMLHGFVFFEREERSFLKHPDFNAIREEDPDLGKEENLRRFEQIYLKRSNVTATGAELENHPIHVFFEDIRQGLKRRDQQLQQAEPAYIRNLRISRRRRTAARSRLRKTKRSSSSIARSPARTNTASSRPCVRASSASWFRRISVTAWKCRRRERRFSRSPIWHWRRGSAISCGHRCPTRSCWTWRPAES